MKTLHFALIGVSILALTAPVIAQDAGKTDRAKKVSRATPGIAASTAMPRPTAPVRSGTDWDFLVGFDRASSPFGHDSN
jgi:hypothetical protein